MNDVGHSAESDVLMDRLAKANESLCAMATDAAFAGADLRAARLAGKAEGVRLAMSYIRDASVTSPGVDQ